MIQIKKLKCGFGIPELGFGTWPMGGYRERDFENDDGRDIEAIKYAIFQGISHFDTAELYANGYSEELLGKAIIGFDRSKLMINSKSKGNHNFEEIIQSCKNSLKRVGIHYFDVYYIHWRDKNIDLKEQIKALDYLKENGFIKNLGVCNFSKESLQEAESYTKNKIVINQVHYNLIFREGEKNNLLEYCQQNDVFLMAWRPLELGKLAKTGNPIMLDIATKYKKKHSQIAINWLISQKNIVTIFKSSSKNHIDENLGGINWNMSLDDVELMREKYIGQIYKSDSVPLN